MISLTKTQFFLFGLAALSMTVHSTTAHESLFRTSSVRGLSRLLQNDHESEDIPSADETTSTDANKASLDADTPSTDVSPSHDGRASPKGGIMAPRARRCTTRKLSE